MLVSEGWCGWFYASVCTSHALTVYPHSTFTVLPTGDTFGIQSNICTKNSFAEIAKAYLKRIKAAAYFCRRAPSSILDRIFDRVLNGTLPNNLVQLEEGLRRSFPPLEFHAGILDSPCLATLLIYTSNKENSSTAQLDKAITCD